jgi:hypothetical protein
MPDLFLPGQTKVKIKTVYSYSSQLDATQSKLEVLLNGKPLKSIALDDKNGKNLAETIIEAPSEEVHTFNDLEFKYHLFPEKYDLCHFVTDVHIWGTIHSSTKVEVPGEIKTPLPDLGLINDAGFPFTAYQDFTEVGLVMPDKPAPLDMETMLQILTRLGRVSSSKAGINLVAYHATSVPDEVKKKDHLIIIGSEEGNTFLKELQSKTHLLISGAYTSLKGVNEKLAELHYSVSQGVLEQMLSPWNNKRVLMLASGKSEEAFKHLGQLFEDDKLFGKIQPGNILVVDDQGPRSLTVLEKGKAIFAIDSDLDAGNSIPQWAWILGAFFAVLGLLTTLRFLFGR